MLQRRNFKIQILKLNLDEYRNVIDNEYQWVINNNESF